MEDKSCGSSIPSSLSLATKPDPLIIEDMQGNINWNVANMNTLCGTVKSEKRSIGGLSWQLEPSKVAPADPAKTALQVQLLAFHPTGRASDWSCNFHATVEITGNSTGRSVFAGSFGWKLDGTPEHNVNSAALFDMDEPLLANTNIKCVITIVKAYGFRPPLRALYSQPIAGFSDVCVVVDNRRFFVLRALLSIHSPTLATTLMGGKEALEETEVVLEYNDAESFEAFLNVVYRVKTIKSAGVEKVISAANYYNSNSILSECAQFLLCEGTGETVQRRLLLADEAKMPEFFDILNYAATQTNVQLSAILSSQDGARLSERAKASIRVLMS